MGIVINQPTEIPMQEVFEQLGIEDIADTGDRAIGYGGPVARDRGFVIHRANESQEWSSSIAVTEDIHLSTSPDIIEALGRDEGPSEWLFALGYAGWSPGQLETELMGDSWITTEANPELVFHTEAADQLKAAASQMGIDLGKLGAARGSA